MEVRSHPRLLQELEEMKERLAELGQRHFGEAWERMRKNENRYRTLFEDASTGLWEEDWSLVQDYLQSLKESGVEDLRSYFTNHPSSMATCLDLIRLLDVNRVALDLCDTDHKRRFRLVSGDSPGSRVELGLLEGILKIFEGANVYSCQLSLELVPGEKRHLQLRIHVPIESRPSLERVFLSVSDVTELKITEEKLRRRLTLEEMVQRVSRRFLFERDLDQAIEASLAEVGLFVGAGRSYVFLFNPEMTRMDNTHEWCDLGVRPEKENLQDLSVADKGWWMRQLREKGQVVIEDMDDLPAEASREQKDLQSQDIRSLVVLAFQIHGRNPGGFVGFDNVAGAGRWDMEDLAVLRVLADLIGNALGRRESISLLKAKEERFRSLFNSISDSVFVYPFCPGGASVKFIEVNDAACTRLGYSREELLRKGPLDVIPSGQYQKYTRRLKRLVREGQYKVESENVTRQGKRFPVEISANFVILEGQEYVITLARDISDLREREKQMEYLASHDALTDLLNRKTMDRLLEWESEKCGRQNLPMGLLLVDIDDLHSVNMTYGNAVGDEIIVDVARVLREEAGEKVLVGRYGGDRFLLLTPGERIAENGLSERISRALRRRNREYQDPDFSVSLSQGCADCEPQPGSSVGSALIEAQKKLEAARRISEETEQGLFQQWFHWGGK